MYSVKKRTTIAIVFIALSLIIGTGFFYLFGQISGFKHQFTSNSFIEIFLACNVALSLIIYLVSLRKDLMETHGKDFKRTLTIILVLVLAQILSSIFPTSATIGLYPVQMAIFHSLILFFSGQCFSSVILAAYISILLCGYKLPALKTLLLFTGVIIMLAISYYSLAIFDSLVVGQLR
ncbi:hypothetical protein MYX76_02945 [Desulfobacterota bacterium AH_259_B03_O07]|nr:hypothetical protein [Desulfobacterota bacterium AH_259_B03_O07]